MPEVTTRTRQLLLRKLRDDMPESGIVLRLMMACNDASLTNQALENAKAVDHGYTDSKTARAAAMYFVRMQLSHLFEGLKVLDDISDSPKLAALINSCDAQTQVSFDDLKPYRSGGSDRARFEQIVGRIRHGLSFHYDQNGKSLAKSLNRKCEVDSTATSSVTRGNHAYKWRFSVADDLIEDIVVVDLWEAGDVLADKESADLVSDEINAIFLAFVDFAGEFIWRYCKSL